MKKLLIILAVFFIFIAFSANTVWAQESYTENNSSSSDPVICKIKIAENVEPVDFHLSDLRRTEKSIKTMLNFVNCFREYKKKSTDTPIIINERTKAEYALRIIAKEKELAGYIAGICQKDEEFKGYWNQKLLSLSLEENPNFQNFTTIVNNPESYTNITYTNSSIEYEIPIGGYYYPTKLRTVTLSDGSTLFTNLVKSSLE